MEEAGKQNREEIRQPLLLIPSHLKSHTNTTTLHSSEKYTTTINMASFFKTLSDDMEKVAQVFEEGYQIMTGAATRMGEAPDATGATDIDDVLEDGNEDNINLEDIEEYGSPLMGMADSVMSDIMSHQVRRRSSFRMIITP